MPTWEQVQEALESIREEAWRDIESIDAKRLDMNSAPEDLAKWDMACGKLAVLSDITLKLIHITNRDDGELPDINLDDFLNLDDEGDADA